MQQKKNIAPLICGIIGTVFGLVGGFLWVACADCIHGLDAALSGDTGGNMVWTVLFILFGLVGPVLGLIGAILAFGYKRAGGALLLVALLFCIGHIVVTVIYTGAGFFTNFVMEACTIFALILYLVATCFGFRKAPAAQPQGIPPVPQQPYYGYGQQPPYGQYGQQPPYYGQPQPPYTPQQPPYAPPQQPPYAPPQQPQFGQPQQPKPQQQPWQVQPPRGDGQDEEK